ncbi:MAG TPA: hypothetical protein VE568_03200 [Rubrobacter sp.]|jgi:hypothetical protein|nr:hypothetical protein [Rubrobacter sp.]
MTSERPHNTEVYYEDEFVFKAAYHDGLGEAEKAATEGLGLDEGVYEVRIRDHDGRVLDTFKGEKR